MNRPLRRISFRRLSGGFVTSVDRGIMPGKTVHLHQRDSLMAAKLAEGALGSITGTVKHSMYKSFTE